MLARAGDFGLSYVGHSYLCRSPPCMSEEGALAGGQTGVVAESNL